MNEMRRLGVGTKPTALGNAERERTTYSQRHIERRSLADRITETVPAVSAELARTAPQVSQPAAASATNAQEAKSSTVIERVIKAGSSKTTTAGSESEEPAQITPQADAKKVTDDAAVTEEKPPGRRRGGLMQRIAGLGEN